MNNKVTAVQTGTYYAPISKFGTGDLAPSGTTAVRVATDNQNAVPSDLLVDTNQMIAPNAGGGGANGESIDYEPGKSNTIATVTGSGTAVDHAAFNSINNSASGGRRRLVADFNVRGAGYNGGRVNPVLGHIGWQFLTGDTDMQSAPEALTITPSIVGVTDRGTTIETYSGTSGATSWYGIQGHNIISPPGDVPTSDSFALSTSATFSQQWRVTGLGFVAGHLDSAPSITAVFTLSDNSQTTLVLTPTNPGPTTFLNETTSGEQSGGEAFMALDLGSLPGNLSIKSVTLTTGRYNQGPLFVDDLAVILSPVPEPGALGLVGIAGGLLAMRRSRRRLVR